MTLPTDSSLIALRLSPGARVWATEALRDAHALGYLTHPAQQHREWRVPRREETRSAQAESCRALLVYIASLERQLEEHVRWQERASTLAALPRLAGLGMVWCAVVFGAALIHPLAGVFLAGAYFLEIGRRVRAQALQEWEVQDPDAPPQHTDVPPAVQFCHPAPAARAPTGKLN